ncbi:MAG: 2-hydroxyacyl-CoA dehydratase, partial [Clostridia bacterium]|nr:2-hydroxyacyl-CoA dehydratase [Clostridia bacterium]
MSERVIFTKEMKKDYTILLPTMLPMHFKILAEMLRSYGYKAELLENTDRSVIDRGLQYVHNDTCYPAILVIGQFIDALQSGKYDPDKVALIYFQTGGGCRASNYVSLLRKALEKAGYGHVPVITFSFQGIEKHPGFQIGIKQLLSIACAVLYGDLLMTLVNQTKPYELQAGEAQRRANLWTERLGRELGTNPKAALHRLKKNYRAILKDFASIPREARDTVRVGVVGEIFVKYSPLGNNNLEDFLVREGAEVDMPGLLDFLLYCVYNNVMDYRLYRRNSRVIYAAYCVAYRYLLHCK